jgi:hypothetical protein
MHKKKSFLIAITIFILGFILSPALARADFFIKKNKHTDAVTMMGQTQPAKDEEGVIWIGKDKMREDMGEESTIIRFDINKIYTIDNSLKTYSEINLPIDMEKILSAESKQMMQVMKLTATLTDTKETQKIKSWNCKKYLLNISASMMGMDMPTTVEIWNTKDLGIDLDLYKKFYSLTLELNPMFKEAMAELEKMEGITVLEKSSMKTMGTEQKYQEEVVSVEKKDAPAGTYDLPKGYKKTAYNPYAQKK